MPRPLFIRLATLALMACVFAAKAADATPAATAVQGPPPSGSTRAPTVAASAPDPLDAFALAPEFRQRIRDRERIDAYLQDHHRVAETPGPAALPPVVTRRAPAGTLHTVRRPIDAATQPWIGSTQALVRVPRGYRSPVLGMPVPAGLAVHRLEATDNHERGAADHIQRHLAQDGLLDTTLRAIELLGASGLHADPSSGTERLARLGLPVDLLAYFHRATATPGSTTVTGWVASLARAVIEANGSAQAKAALGDVQFRFQPCLPGFLAAEESGRHGVALVRMQLGGGGWRDGVVQGGILHALSQIVDVFPNADYLVSAPAEFADLLATMASNGWRLRRPNQLRIIAEPLRLSAWTQDNGKAGYVIDRTHHGVTAATLVPRFASQGEGRSDLEPNDTIAAAGLRSAGHLVAQSSLLFQGGNLMPLPFPGQPAQRLLLVGEGEIARNVALGLTPNQVVSAFRTEFGVDRVAVVPSVSFHLDFDLTVRTHDGAMIAFVNDPLAASRRIATLGIEALARHGTLAADQAATVRELLEAGRHGEMLRLLRAVLPSLTGAAHEYPADLARAFAPRPIDDARGNLRIFLVALDVLDSALPAVQRLAAQPIREAYLDALGRLERARVAQTEALAQLGFRVVPVPSMPDLSRSANYVNGLQHEAGYVMPVFDGFLAPLDRAAMAAFHAVLGAGFRIALVRCGQVQRQHGGVHCAAAVYPLIPSRPGSPEPTP